jgi:uroporphyrinogen decarboxylase
MDVSHIRAEAEKYEREYAILGGDWSAFFHDAVDLLGMDVLFLKMYDEPELVDALLQHIVDYYVDVSRRIFDAAASAIDIFFIGNDFGSQRGPLMSEGLFRRFFLPHLERLARLGHDYGLKVMMHCCGGYAPLIPQMIQAGLDGLHAVQPSCDGMDLMTLKRRFGGKLVFNGGIDSHHVLIRGTPEFVRGETRKVLDIMKPGGGYVAGASHDWILEETPIENVLAMFDAIREFGSYSSGGH